MCPAGEPHWQPPCRCQTFYSDEGIHSNSDLGCLKEMVVLIDTRLTNSPFELKASPDKSTLPGKDLEGHCPAPGRSLRSSLPNPSETS